MKRLAVSVFSGLCLLGVAFPVHAEFSLSSAIIEFTAGGPQQQDVELSSRSSDSDYIVTEVFRVPNPGAEQEARVAIEDPAEEGLLVTPDKLVLPAGGRQVLRFVLLRAPDAQEHIYRVAIKPVIHAIETDQQLGLKILVGYEALVIVRPQTIRSAFTLTRQGRTLLIRNHGNSNILLQSGKQCPAENTEECTPLPFLRLYAGASATVPLPLDGPLEYAVWDGIKSHTQKID